MEIYCTPFKLTVNSRVLPHDGEETGRALETAADLFQEHIIEKGWNQGYYAKYIAQLYTLASQAWAAGAAVSIGHGRADRYQEAATRCATKAARLTDAHLTLADILRSDAAHRDMQED